MKLIALHSMPRSGSTWLGSILDSCPSVVYKMQPLFSYSLKGFLRNDSSLKEIESFKEKLLNLSDPFVDQNLKKEAGIVPSFRKNEIRFISYKETRYHYILENLLEKEEDAKVIGLIRNPLAQLSSWFRAPKEFDPNWKIEEEWKFGRKKNNNNKEEYYGFDKWKEVAYLLHNLKSKFPDRVYIMNYKLLLEDPVLRTKDLFQFLDFPYTKQTEDFLIISRNSNDDDPYGVYKSKVNDDYWKKDIPDFIVEKVISNLKGTILEQYLK